MKAAEAEIRIFCLPIVYLEAQGLKCKDHMAVILHYLFNWNE
jgi:hypothetical protein